MILGLAVLFGLLVSTTEAAAQQSRVFVTSTTTDGTMFGVGGLAGPRGIALGPHDHEVVAHHVGAFDPGAALDELLLGVPCVDEEDVRVLALPESERLTRPHGKHLHRVPGVGGLECGDQLVEEPRILRRRRRSKDHVLALHVRKAG